MVIAQGNKHGGLSLTLASRRTTGSANHPAPVNFASHTCSHLFFFIKRRSKLIHLLTRQFITDMGPAKSGGDCDAAATVFLARLQLITSVINV